MPTREASAPGLAVAQPPCLQEIPVKLFRVLALAGILVSLAVSVSAVSAASDARVRVLHASPDAPAVDVYLDGSKVSALTNVPFGAISDYLAIPAGSHKVAYQIGPAASQA